MTIIGGPRRTRLSAYSVQLGICISTRESDDALEDMLGSLFNIQATSPALLDWSVRVTRIGDEAVWALFEALVLADAPGTAARLSEDWMRQAGDGIVPNRHPSTGFAAQVLA